MKCSKCQKELHPERPFDTCIDCTPQTPHNAQLCVNHKTGNEFVIIKDEEQLRLAKRCQRKGWHCIR